MRLLPLSLLLACTSTQLGPTDEVSDPSETDTEAGPTDDTFGNPGSDTESEPEETESPPDTEDTDSEWSDEDWARAMLAGTVDVDEAVAAISWGDGFPVHTKDDTWLFFHFDVSDSFSLAGDHDDWSLAPMYATDDFHWLEVSISAPEGSTYKFVGSSEDYIADPWSRSYTYDAYGEISYVQAPTDTWRLDRWPDLEGAGLSARTMRVYVPAGSGPFPVLYAQDGQNLFDPDAIWGGWQLQDAIAAAAVDVLVVALDNTSDRMDEYTHVADSVSGVSSTGNGAAYASLVHETVRPHIEDVYGSNGTDGLLGSSLGGLISLYIAAENPGEYDFVAAMSPTLGWGAYSSDQDTMEAVYVAQGLADTVLYLDSGGSSGDGSCDDVDGDGYPEDDPDDSDNYCVTRQFVDTMADDVGYTWDDTLYHWWEPDAEHNELAWASRVSLPLELFGSL